MSTVIATTPAVAICRDASCQHALSHVSLCTCPCAGSGHGAVHAATRQAARDRITTRSARLGDPFLGAATHDVDEPMPVRRRPIDPEDMF